MKYLLRQDQKEFTLELRKQGHDFILEFESQKIEGRLLRIDSSRLELQIGGQKRLAFWAKGEDWIELRLPEGHFHFDLQKARRSSAALEHASGLVYSNMPGKVLKLNVAVGDSVKPGDLLVVLEAMKMEHRLFSSVS